MKLFTEVRKMFSTHLSVHYLSKLKTRTLPASTQKTLSLESKHKTGMDKI